MFLRILNQKYYKNKFPTYMFFHTMDHECSFETSSKYELKIWMDLNGYSFGGVKHRHPIERDSKPIFIDIYLV